MSNAPTLQRALSDMYSALQNDPENDIMQMGKAPEAVERLMEEMRKDIYIKELITKIGEPRLLGGKYPRYGWYPFGYNGTYVRGKTVDDVYCKTWELYRKNEAEKSLTLEQALELYVEYKRDVKGNTKQKYRDNIRKFLPDYLDEPLASLTALEIEKSYFDIIASSHPHKTTVNGFRGTLERVLKHAKKHYKQKYQFDIDELLEELRENTNKKLLKGHRQAVLFQAPADRYTPQEAEAFLREALRRDNLKALAAAMVFFTGCRASEICGAFKEDFDRDSHIFHIRHAALVDKQTNRYYIGEPKENKERVVVWPDKADVIIDRIEKLNRGSCRYMFPDFTGKQDVGWIRIRQLDCEIATICKCLGMEKKSAHDIRRTYDSMLDEVNMPSSLRHLLVGHELTGIDSHYLRDSHRVDDVRRIVNQAFDGFAEDMVESTSKTYPKNLRGETGLCV